MMAHIAAISILPSLVAKLPHDTQTEFAPISLAAIGADTVGNSPEEFTAFIRIETEKYARIVKAANIKFD